MPSWSTPLAGIASGASSSPTGCGSPWRSGSRPQLGLLESLLCAITTKDVVPPFFSGKPGCFRWACSHSSSRDSSGRCGLCVGKMPSSRKWSLTNSVSMSNCAPCHVCHHRLFLRRIGRTLRTRQIYQKITALTFSRTFHIHPPAVRFDNRLNDRQSQPCAAAVTRGVDH